MAAFLKAQDWEPGSRVAILSRNCAWWIMADMAIWMAGYVSVPIYPSLRAESVRQILEHSEARACFIGATDEKERAAEGVPDEVMLRVLSYRAAREPPAMAGSGGRPPAHRGNPTRRPSDLATIIYTSGTTGRPKGVMHRFGGFSFDARIASRLLELTVDQRILSYLPLAHIVERAGVEAVSFRPDRASSSPRAWRPSWRICIAPGPPSSCRCRGSC